MRRCRTRIIWSDGHETECFRFIHEEGAMECYHHAKYFTKTRLGDGKEHYLSGPVYNDRKRVHHKGLYCQRYITAVKSVNRGVTREIGDEHSGD
jgi:hypothetical protein